MPSEPLHLSDEEILLAVDGEASRSAARQAREHLTACRLCRSRLAELETTIGEFVSVHRQSLDPQLPSAAGSQAQLRARLSQAEGEPPEAGWRGFFRHHVPPWPSPYLTAGYLCAALLISVLGGNLLLENSRAHRQSMAHLSSPLGAVPDPNLTPGATRPVSAAEVCSMPHEEVVRDVPSSLRQRVFQEYGIMNPRPEDYEIDYLIAPGLGGTEDIHNLWPEPSTTSAWNAHVKDALEERLHQLVCDGKLDLATAQKAIAKDWITAYKKYLSTYAFSGDRTRLPGPTLRNPS
jgi:hypothetical protein